MSFNMGDVSPSGPFLTYARQQHNQRCLLHPSPAVDPPHYVGYGCKVKINNVPANSTNNGQAWA